MVSSHITVEILYMCILLTNILKTAPAVTQIGPEKDAKQNSFLSSRDLSHKGPSVWFSQSVTVTRLFHLQTNIMIK